MALQIVSPDARYARSYAEALREGLHLAAAKEADIDRIATDFAGWLKERTDLDKPVILADGTAVPRVPETRLWLVQGDRFMGEANIRHSLTDALRAEGGHIGYSVRATERRKGYGRMMLQAALKVAGALGLSEVLVTCNDDNIGSIRVIESAGGQLEDKIQLAHKPVATRRYWIKLKP